jgi:hypothetical protein
VSVRGRLQHLRRDSQRGAIVVLFALFLTVLLGIGSIVLDVGNWYVLKRHLQTQVDAAALAGGPGFTGCFQNEAAATAAVRDGALDYAGDPTREPATENPLMQDTTDVHVVLNSTEYWSKGDAPDANDWSLGEPCDTAYLDVKATDDEAPLLWGWIPFFPDINTRAKVEISKIESTDGLRPLGVPEVDPEQVAVVFVNEDGNPSDPNSVRGYSLLDPQTTPPTGLEGMAVWSRDFVSPVGINGGENFGVIVVVSRSSTPLTFAGRTLSQICNQGSPGQVQCYAGNTLESGASFIHAYSTTGNGSGNAPLIRGVTLGGGCADSLSAPYFNLMAGTDDDGDGDIDTLCPFQIFANIDFGTGANDPRLPVAQGGVCARVSATKVPGNLTWSGGVWSGGFTLDPESGGAANEIDLTWTTDTVGGCGGPGGRNGTFNKVAKPYVANDASGPLQYLKVDLSSGAIANSMEKESAASLDVTVGFQSPLRDRPLTDPPIRLRVWDTPSQTQALDCGSGAGGWGEAMVNGCLDEYQEYDEAKHTSKCGPPPTGVPAADPPDCISSQNGNYQQNRVINMLTPCAENPNRWDGTNIPPASDKRWMPLFILDELAFIQSGKKTYPIRRFGMFYVTAVSGLNCPGDNPPSIQSNKREMWGHFITYITPGFGETIPSLEACSFQEAELCVSNLVE